jgi:GntR family transcriptional regulator / MocR family aminotransferase
MDLAIDRALPLSLSDQICAGIRAAIRRETLVPGARLPSWQDLSIQLGVARGTVRVAYERLIDEGLLVASGPAGTHVAGTAAAGPAGPGDRFADLQALPPFFGPPYFGPGGPGLFQMGIPAEDAFPAKLWARLHRRAADTQAMRTRHQDPRGSEALRHEIAAHLAIARGLPCTPGQVFVTNGFRGALGLILRAVSCQGRRAWMEEPGFPVTRHGLRLAGVDPVGIAVDAQGIDVDLGMRIAGHAALAIVTPGQQAPLGPVLSAGRRHALLAWARAAQAWIIEDDYLSELQLEGRAAPALAGQDPAGRVIHVGSFSKTISPSLGLGFLVAPEGLAERLISVAAYLAPPPNAAAQDSLAAFLREGHYLRHLRKMKRLYARRRDAAIAAFAAHGRSVHPAGLALHLPLERDVDDTALLPSLRAAGFSPTPLSPWYANAAGPRGLVLGITNAASDLDRAVARMLHLIDGPPR